MKSKTTLAVLFVSATLPTNAQMSGFSLRTNNQEAIDEAMPGASVRINQPYELCDTVNNRDLNQDLKDYFSTSPLFGFSLRTNNQQVIDEALSGAFVRISQSYELRDTVENQNFGRGGKDYFSIIPFLGVETERGLVFPTAALSPWTCDKDFEEYEGKYKPSVNATELALLNCANKPTHSADSLIRGTRLTNHLCCLGDSIHFPDRLRVDTIPGKKKGRLIWLTSDQNQAENILQEIEVPTDGKPLPIEKPNVTGTVYGGIYVTPTQTGIGQITFTLSGVIVPDGEGWLLDFPFIGQDKKSESLTPIREAIEKGNDDTHKKKKGKRK